jgi:hypothetical protein
MKMPKKSPNKHANKNIARKSNYARHPSNPYRRNSGYALVYDILASHIEGMRRDQLIYLYAKESGKDMKKARWDVLIVTSVNEDGSGHPSSQRYAYWVDKGAGGFLKLHMDNRAA